MNTKHKPETQTNENNKRNQEDETRNANAYANQNKQRTNEDETQKANTTKKKKTAQQTTEIMEAKHKTRNTTNQDE